MSEANDDFFCDFKWANSLTDEQINLLCDMGYYNNAIRGYIIAASKCAGLSKITALKLLEGLNEAFEDLNKTDAEAVLQDFGLLPIENFNDEKSRK